MDLQPFICPVNGEKYRLFGLGDEHCQSVLMPDGGINFLKNRHYESLWYDRDHIYRGEDTSMISSDGVNPIGTYYVLTDGFIYPSKWIKRQMIKGQSYHRDATVSIYKYTGQLLRRYLDSSNITFREFHRTYTFQSGITLADVIELTWTGEEAYLYAYGFGLVGWKNIRTNREGSFIGAYGANIRSPFPVPVNRPVRKKLITKMLINDPTLALLEAFK